VDQVIEFLIYLFIYFDDFFFFFFFFEKELQGSKIILK